MRIALVVERFQPDGGGVENVAWQSAHGLARAGDELVVIAREASPEARVPVTRVSVPTAWQPLRVLAFSAAAARAAPRGSFDAVYSLCRTAHQDVYRAGAGSHADYLAHRFRGAGRLLRRASPRHRALLALERRAFRDTSQLVVCGSEMVRRELRERHAVADERSALVRNGVDLERFHPRRRERARARLRPELGAGERCVWLFAGSGFARKGLDTALRAVARRADDSQLWVAGRGDASPFRRLAASLGIASRVHFLGVRDDLPDLYSAADALLLPTRYDAFANVCLEAAAAGLPVLTSRANGAAELFEGAAPEADDVEGFAAALAALSDAAMRERLGAAGRRVAEAHGWDEHVRTLRAVLARVAA